MSAKQPLTDRTLVVSGASRGIGLAIALGAARHGANVVLLAKTAEPHPKLPGTVYTAAKDIEAAGGKAVAVVGDVRSEDDVARAVDAAVEHFGGVDICINNASAIGTEPTEKLSAKKFDLMQQINIRGTFLLTEGLPAASAHFAQRPCGDHRSAAEPQPALAGRSPGLHPVEVRHDTAVDGLGGRICRHRNRIHLPVAGDLHRDVGGGERAGLRERARVLAQPRDHGRRRRGDPHLARSRGERASA